MVAVEFLSQHSSTSNVDRLSSETDAAVTKVQCGNGQLVACDHGQPVLASRIRLVSHTARYSLSVILTSQDAYTGLLLTSVGD